MIDIDLGLAPRIIRPHPKVDAQRGRLALMVGSLVYCLEQVDNPGIALRHINVAGNVEPELHFEKGLLGGVNVLTFPATEWKDPQNPQVVSVRAIPYYVWANRESGYMNVWLATDKQLAINPPPSGPSPRPVPPVEITKPAE